MGTTLPSAPEGTLVPPDEWKECRATIGRLDTTLADLRKYSFSLVTALIAGSGFLTAFLGHPQAGMDPLPSASKAAVIIAIMALIAALFLLDRHYTVLLSGAIERALDMERDFPHRATTEYLTERVSWNSTNARTNVAAVLLYVGLECTALGLGVAAFGSGPTWTGLNEYWGSLVLLSGVDAGQPNAIVPWLLALVCILLVPLAFLRSQVLLIKRSTGIFVAIGSIACLVVVWRMVGYVPFWQTVTAILVAIVMVISVGARSNRVRPARDFARASTLTYYVRRRRAPALSPSPDLSPSPERKPFPVARGWFPTWWARLRGPNALTEDDPEGMLLTASTNPHRTCALVLRGGIATAFLVPTSDDKKWRSPKTHWFPPIPWLTTPSLIKDARQRFEQELLPQWQKPARNNELCFVRGEIDDGQTPHWDDFCAKLVAYACGLAVVLTAAAVVHALWSRNGYRGVLEMLAAGAVCLVGVIGYFVVTEVLFRTIRTKPRGHFVQAEGALRLAYNLQWKARSSIKGVWSFTRLREDALDAYFEATLMHARANKVGTTRIIDIEDVPTTDIAEHLTAHRASLGSMYEVYLARDIYQEMLIIDNIEAARFFLLDDPTTRSWNHHADPRHVVIADEQFSELLAKATRVTQCFGTQREWQDWLEKQRALILCPTLPQAAPEKTTSNGVAV